jgi:hypothetical protein
VQGGFRGMAAHMVSRLGSIGGKRD